MKRFSILIAALCLCLTGCGKQTTEATAQIFAMDTVMEVAAYGPKAEKAVQETEGQIKALENQLSRTKADSDVSRVNHNGTTPTTGLTYGTRALLPAALSCASAKRMAQRRTGATSSTRRSGRCCCGRWRNTVRSRLV